MTTTLSSLSQNQIKLIDGEPRMRDTDLGAVLGLAQPLDIRRRIAENIEELKLYGTIRAARESFSSGNGAVRETTVYYLLEGQALCIVALSRAPNAPAIRKVIIEGFMAARGAGPIAVPQAKSDPCALPDRLSVKGALALIPALGDLLKDLSDRLYAQKEWQEAMARTMIAPKDLGVPVVRSPEKTTAYPSAPRPPVESGLNIRSSVRRFVEEETARAIGKRTSASRLYEAYVSWCGRNRLGPVTQTLFGRNLLKLGCAKLKSGVHFYEDIVLAGEVDTENQ